MATPSLPAQPVRPFKRLAILSFFGGVGIAIACGLAIACIHWYETKPQPWKSKAIKAHLIETTWYPVFNDEYLKELSNHRNGQQMPPPHPGFIPVHGTMWVNLAFDLENTTAYDYTLQTSTAYGIVAMQRLKSNQSLEKITSLYWQPYTGGGAGRESRDNSVLIPAHQTVRVWFNNAYWISGEEDPSNEKDWENKEVQKQLVADSLKDLDSFVIFDETAHYRIELPLKGAVRD